MLRLRLMGQHMLTALAGYQRGMARGYPFPPIALFLSNLVDSMAAYVAAQPSQATLDAMAAVEVESA